MLGAPPLKRTGEQVWLNVPALNTAQLYRCQGLTARSRMFVRRTKKKPGKKRKKIYESILDMTPGVSHVKRETYIKKRNTRNRLETKAAKLR